MKPAAALVAFALVFAACTGDEGTTIETTSPVTTSPVTTSPPTTSPVTTSSVTTSPPTTTPPTTSAPQIPPELSGLPITRAVLDGEEILLAVADTDETRARGLMGVSDLEDLFGMLFVFPEPRQTGFWMRDVLFPLDIAFFDSDGGYVDHLSMDTCPDGDCPSHPTPGPVGWAIEARAGAFDDLGPGSVLALEG